MHEKLHNEDEKTEYDAIYSDIWSLSITFIVSARRAEARSETEFIDAAREGRYNDIKLPELYSPKFREMLI